MGFLGEIERKRQQEIRQGLIRKAELEEQQRLKIQSDAERQEKAKRDAISFIQDRSTITGLLDQLNKFGYRDYFKEVARISGFELKQGFYIKYQGYEASVNPELVRKQSTQRELEDASSRFGWPGLEKQTMDPDVMFFKDKVTTVEEKKLTEPKGLGIGVRFLKQAVRTDSHRDQLSEFFRRSYSFPIETWDHAAYVRIDSHSKATITGSNQRQVDLKDVRLFDEVLEQAIHNPAIIHTERMEAWNPSRRSSGYSGHNSESHGDMN